MEENEMRTLVKKAVVAVSAVALVLVTSEAAALAGVFLTGAD